MKSQQSSCHDLPHSYLSPAPIGLFVSADIQIRMQQVLPSRLIFFPEFQSNEFQSFGDDQGISLNIYDFNT